MSLLKTCCYKEKKHKNVFNSKLIFYLRFSDKQAGNALKMLKTPYAISLLLTNEILMLIFEYLIMESIVRIN